MEQSTRPPIGFAKSIAFVLAASILVLADAEIALQVVLPPPPERDPTDFEVDRFELDLLWLPEPFESTEAGRAKREHPFVGAGSVSTTPPPGTVRIITMGGSVTQGWPHEPAVSYPARLETVLNETAPDGVRFEVLNAGALGANSCMGVFMFDQVLRGYDPDIVTVHYTLNDIITSRTVGNFVTDRDYVRWHRRVERSPILRRARGGLRRLALYRALSRVADAAGAAVSRTDDWQSGGRWIPSRVPPDDFARNLNRFADFAKDDGFEAVFLYEAERNTAYEPDVVNVRVPYWDAMNEVAAQRGVALLTPDRVLNRRPRPRANFFLDGCHMTEAGLALFAGQLAADLHERGVIERAIARVRVRDAL